MFESSKVLGKMLDEFNSSIAIQDTKIDVCSKIRESLVHEFLSSLLLLNKRTPNTFLSNSVISFASASKTLGLLIVIAGCEGFGSSV
jgi:hypothetical protein